MARLVHYEELPFEQFDYRRCLKAAILIIFSIFAWLYAYTGAIVFEVSKVINHPARPIGEQAVSLSSIAVSLLPFVLYVLGLLWLFRLFPRQREELYEKYLRELHEADRYETERLAAVYMTGRSEQERSISDQVNKERPKGISGGGVDVDKVEVVSGVTVADIRALFDKNSKRYRPPLAAAVWLWCSFEEKGVPDGKTPKQEAERRLGAEIPSEISTNWTDKEEGEILKMVNWQKTPTKKG